jgi:cell division protein FtsB
LRVAAEQWAHLRAWLREDDGSWNETAPRPFLLFLSLFGVAMIAISLFGDQGLFAYRSLANQARQLRQEVTALESQEDDLARQIHALRSDPAAIEKLARQKLGFAKPGEIVIQLPRQ